MQQRCNVQHCARGSTEGAAQVDEYYTGNTKPPMQYCEEAPPIKCHGTVVASTGSKPMPDRQAVQQQR